MKRNSSEGRRPNTSSGFGFTSISEAKFSADPFHPYNNSPVLQRNLEGFIQGFENRPDPNEFAHSHVNYYRMSSAKEGATSVLEQKKRQIKGEQAMKDVLEVLPEMSRRVAGHQQETLQKMSLLRRNKLGTVKYENDEEEEKEKLRQNLEKRQKKDIQYKFKNVAHKQRQLKTLRVIQAMVGRIVDDKKKGKKVVKYITDFKKNKTDLMKPILVAGQHRKGEAGVVTPMNDVKKQLVTEIQNMRRTDKLIQEFGMFFKNIPLLSIDNTNPMKSIQPTTQSQQKINYLKNYDSLMNDEKVKRLRIRKVVRDNFIKPGSMNEIKADENETFFPTQTAADKHLRGSEKKNTQKSQLDSDDRDKEEPIDDRNEYYQEYLSLLSGEREELNRGSEHLHSYEMNFREIWSSNKKVRKKVGETLSKQFEIITDDFKRLSQKYNNSGTDILGAEMNQGLIQDMKREKSRKDSQDFKKRIL